MKENTTVSTPFFQQIADYISTWFGLVRLRSLTIAHQPSLTKQASNGGSAVNRVFRSLHVLFMFVFAVCIFNSCKNEIQTKCKDCLILHASLEEEDVSLNRLFDKIELIPLETNDQSLISKIEKYDYWNGKHYIFDERQFILFFFDEEGHYVNRIAKRGQGPGEYNFVYDFALNPSKGLIHLSSPHKYIYCYDFEGKHIKTYDFTLSLPGIQEMAILDDDFFIIWTSNSLDDHDCMFIISQETGKIVNSFYKNKSVYNKWTSNVFRMYNNDTYFHLWLFNTVYKITKDGYTESYEWNFGNETMDIMRYDIFTSVQNLNKDMDNLEQKIQNGVIPYEITRNFQNLHYYCAQLRFDRKTEKTVLYDKKSGKSIFFELTTEGIQFFPILYFGDEYMISALNYDDREKLLDCPLLEETDREKLLSFKWDDNPFLVRYYFKK